MYKSQLILMSGVVVQGHIDIVCMMFTLSVRQSQVPFETSYLIFRKIAFLFHLYLWKEPCLSLFKQENFLEKMYAIMVGFWGVLQMILSSEGARKVWLPSTSYWRMTSSLVFLPKFHWFFTMHSKSQSPTWQSWFMRISHKLIYRFHSFTFEMVQTVYLPVVSLK